MQLALQDVKDGFAGLGPISDEGDRVTLVRLYLVGLSYAMGIVPVGKEAVGKTWRGEEALFLFVVVSCPGDGVFWLGLLGLFNSCACIALPLTHGLCSLPAYVHVNHLRRVPCLRSVSLILYFPSS